MIKQCCDICHKEVSNVRCTKVWLRDWKSAIIDWCGYMPSDRTWKGVICNSCLEKLRGEEKCQTNKSEQL